MTKSTVVIAAFAGAFALALLVSGMVMLASSVLANEPIYRLDARYHNLPPKLVAELMAHPPKRAPLAPYLQCQTASIDGEEVTYCVCFDRETCANAPEFPGMTRPWGYERWVCTDPVGAIDDHGLGVCRARNDSVTVTG